MDNSFREKLLSILILLGSISSAVNIPVLYFLNITFMSLVALFSLAYILILIAFKRGWLDYQKSSIIALMMLYIQTLGIPVSLGTDTELLSWMLVFPIVSFTLKSNKTALILSLLLLSTLLFMFVMGYIHHSYNIRHMITFGMLYILIVSIFYFINKNVHDKERQLLSYNDLLEESIEDAVKAIADKNRDLHESVQKFQNVLDTTMEMIVLFGNDKKILEVNQSGILMLGYSDKSEVIGRNIEEFILPGELHKVQESMQREISKPYELKLLKKDGTVLPTLNSARNIIHDGHKVRMSTLMDLTHIKDNEALLLQQSKLAQMGEMISLIAHQWRQPLSAISSALMSIQLKQQTGQYDFNLEKDRNDYFEFTNLKHKNMSDYVQFLSQTIDDFRNFFKPNKEREEVSLNSPLDRALQIVTPSMQARGIDIRKAYACDATVLMYQNEIMQVILNILKNAEDIFIEENTLNPIIMIETLKDKRHNKIRICNNGSSIPDAIMPKIFDPYFSTKLEKNGTGLGLYMSKMMVEEHNNGKLTAYNTPMGVCFEIIFKGNGHV